MYIVHSDQWLRYAPCGCSPAVDEMRRLHAIVMCLRFCRGHIHSMCHGVFGFRPCSGLPKGPVDQEQCPPRRLTGRPGWRRGLGDSHISSVGAGLLAMASARFNSNTAPLASRASPLPHGVVQFQALTFAFAVARGMYKQRECPYSIWAFVADMYLVLQLFTPSTYPFDAPRLSTGSALTAAHFCQTATKVPKKALPRRTALASLRCPSFRSRSVGTP